MTNSMQVEFRSGDDVAGRVCDQHGNTWPFASWLDLLSLIERLRIDQGDSSTMYPAHTRDKVPPILATEKATRFRSEIPLEESRGGVIHISGRTNPVDPPLVAGEGGQDA